MAVRTLTILLAWIAGFTALGQGRGMRYQIEVQQLADLQQGVLLVPIDMRNTGLGRADSEASTILERIERQEIQEAFASQFSFAQVLFYNSADSLERFAPAMLETWTVQGDPPENWPPEEDKIFVLDRKEPGKKLGQDVIAFNRGIQKREQKGVENKARHIEKRALKAQKLRQKIQLHAEKWDEEKLTRMADQLAELENGRDTTEFLLTYSAFNPENIQFPGWVVHRLNRVEVIPNERFRYLFDYHYFVRLHEEVAPDIRYDRAVSHLQRILQERQTALEQRFD